MGFFETTTTMTIQGTAWLLLDVIVNFMWTVSQFICWRTLVSAINMVDIIRYFTWILFLCFRLTQDPKSGNWRVYLKEGEVNRPAVPARTRVSRGDGLSPDTTRRNTRLSSVMKNKALTGTSHPQRPVCNTCWCILPHTLCERRFKKHVSNKKLICCWDSRSYCIRDSLVVSVLD